MSGLADNRETELRLGPKGRAVFTPAGWNAALRDAGIAAGNWWIANYGPLRWNAGYAMANLGYDPGKRKRKRLARGEPPFFSTGAFQSGFNSQAKTTAVAKNGGARFWIVAPGGRLNFHPKHVKAFRTLPPREKAAVAREYRRAIILALRAQRAAVAADPTARMTARQARRYRERQFFARMRADAKAHARMQRADARATTHADKATRRMEVRAARRAARAQRRTRATTRNAT